MQLEMNMGGCNPFWISNLNQLVSDVMSLLFLTFLRVLIPWFSSPLRTVVIRTTCPHGELAHDLFRPISTPLTPMSFQSIFSPGGQLSREQFHLRRPGQTKTQFSVHRIIQCRRLMQKQRPAVQQGGRKKHSLFLFYFPNSFKPILVLICNFIGVQKPRGIKRNKFKSSLELKLDSF